MINMAPKLSGDEEIFTASFVGDLASSETIVSAVWGCDVVTGTDPASASMISGATTITGEKVSQMISGGVPRVSYLITCTATTSIGQVITKYCQFSVVDKLTLP